MVLPSPESASRIPLYTISTKSKPFGEGTLRVARAHLNGIHMIITPGDERGYDIALFGEDSKGDLDVTESIREGFLDGHPGKDPKELEEVAEFFSSLLARDSALVHQVFDQEERANALSLKELARQMKKSGEIK